MISDIVYTCKQYWSLQKSRVIVDVSIKILSAILLSIQSIGVIYLLTHFYETKSPFLYVIICIVGIGAFQLISDSFISWHNTVQHESDVIYAKEHFNKKIIYSAIRVDYQQFLKTKFYNQYELSMQAANDSFEQLYNELLNGIFQLTALFSALVAIISIDWRLLFFSVFSILAVFLVKKINRTIYYKNKEQLMPHRRKEILPNLLARKETNIDLKTSDLSTVFRHFYDNSYQEELKIKTSASHKLIPLNMLLTASSIDLVYVFALLFSISLFFHDKSFSISQFSILFSSLILFLSRVRNLFQVFSSIDSCNLYIDSFRRFTTEEKKNQLSIPRIFSISLNSVDYRYPDVHKNSLVNISFSIHKEEKIAIIGTNGSGKSTLLKLLSGFLTPSKGAIVANEKIDYKNIDLSSQITYMSQDFCLFPVTIIENIRGDSKNKGLNSIVDQEWFGNIRDLLDKKLGKEFYKDGIILSGGQEQKVALARSLFQEKEYLLLDEATSAMDLISEQQVFEQINNLESTVVYVTHRKHIALQASRILFLDKGKLIFDGTPTEIINKPFFKELFSKEDTDKNES